MKHDDIQNDIDIIYKAIKQYDIILTKRYYDKEIKQKVRVHLERELELLEKYKEKYPEYFI